MTTTSLFSLGDDNHVYAQFFFVLSIRESTEISSLFFTSTILFLCFLSKKLGNELLFILTMNLILNKFFFSPLLSIFTSLSSIWFCLFSIKTRFMVFISSLISRRNCFSGKRKWRFEPKWLEPKNQNTFFQQFLKRILKFYQESQSQVELYRHRIALTQDEINNLHKKETYCIDLNLNKTFRCPLQSCQHKPLNSFYTEKHINSLCQIYHNNDNKQ